MLVAFERERRRARFISCSRIETAEAREQPGDPARRARFISCSRIETSHARERPRENRVGHDSFRARGLKHQIRPQFDAALVVGHDSFRARGLKQLLPKPCKPLGGVGHDSFRARGLKLLEYTPELTSQCRARVISCSRIETSSTCMISAVASGRARFISCSRIETPFPGAWMTSPSNVGHDSFRARGLKLVGQVNGGDGGMSGTIHFVLED